MGGCQNYGPFLGTLNIRCRTIMGTQKGTIILTTTHVGFRVVRFQVYRLKAFFFGFGFVVVVHAQLGTGRRIGVKSIYARDPFPQSQLGMDRSFVLPPSASGLQV